MASTRASASIWDLRREDVTLKRQASLPGRLFLELGDLVHVTLGTPDSDLAAEASAMRRLAEVAAEAAEDLERRAAEGRGSEEGSADGAV